MYDNYSKLRAKTLKLLKNKGYVYCYYITYYLYIVGGNTAVIGCEYIL